MLFRQFRKFLKQFASGRRALALVWNAARWWTLAWSILLILQGLIPAGLALLLRTLVNRLVASPDWTRIAPPAIGIAALWIIAQFLASAIKWIRQVQSELVKDEVYGLIHEHALNLDLAFFDHPDSYDLLHRARVDAVSQPLALLESIGGIVQNSLGFLVLAGILWKYASWLPVLLLCTAVPGLLLIARQILEEHHWQLNHTFQERRSRYVDWLMTDQTVAPELRLFGLGSFHRTSFQEIRNNLRESLLKLGRKGALIELLAGMLAWVGSIAGLGWVLQQTIAGKLKLGDLILCLQAFQQGQSQLRALLQGSGATYRSLLFVQNLDNFLKVTPRLLPGRAGDAGLPIRQSIRFENVGFTYPGSFHPALDQFNLEIPQGKVVAIVGHNGAGKSTLIKLLCRFYDPSEGHILLDGEDLRNFDQEALRSQIAVLFQSPVNYHASVRDNIAFGDILRRDNHSAIQQAARDAGAMEPIERLHNGFDSILGKWFGGEELSGGEWQRVALARAFFRNASLIILDEPTSSMDSWAEQDWLQRFRSLTRGKTALMITHRFTTAMYADIIHVMDKGRVIESGTHQQLVSMNGAYATSWANQVRETESAERPR
jgi:ATP-binding cassette subfamily B protein